MFLPNRRVVSSSNMRSSRALLGAFAVSVVVAGILGSSVHASSRSLMSSPSTSTTTVTAPTVSVKPFTWSKRTLNAGTTLKISKLVSTKVKGTRTYRATGACTLRNNVVSFKRAGKCRVLISVQLKKGAKVSRASKALVVNAKKPSYLEPKLAGTPEEQMNQLLPVFVKLDALNGYGEWALAFYKLKTSVAPYGMTIKPYLGFGVYKVTVGGLTSCFLNDEANDHQHPGIIMMPYSCSKECVDHEWTRKNPFFECRLFPQLQLTGTPQEKAAQLVTALEKVAAISDLETRNNSLFEMNRSISSYSLTVHSRAYSLSDIEKGKNRDSYYITQWDETGRLGRSTCFLWTNVSGSVDQKYLKPSPCTF